MTPYAQLPTHKPEEYIRIVGLSQEDFLHLNRKLSDYLTNKRPSIRWQDGDGKTPSWPWKPLVADTLLSSPLSTLINLAAVFGISESYCHKVYARTARMLAKVEKLPNRKALLEDPAATLSHWCFGAAHRTPCQNQKAYYSGKKTPHGQGPARDLHVDAGYPLLLVSKGQQHDFLVFKNSRLVLHPDALLWRIRIPRDTQTPSEFDPAGQKEKRPVSFRGRQSA